MYTFHCEFEIFKVIDHFVPQTATCFYNTNNKHNNHPTFCLVNYKPKYISSWQKMMVWMLKYSFMQPQYNAIQSSSNDFLTSHNMILCQNLGVVQHNFHLQLPCENKCSFDRERKESICSWSCYLRQKNDKTSWSPPVAGCSIMS